MIFKALLSALRLAFGRGKHEDTKPKDQVVEMRVADEASLNAKK
jgi:hypothetical protein